MDTQTATPYERIKLSMERVDAILAEDRARPKEVPAAPPRRGLLDWIIQATAGVNTLVMVPLAVGGVISLFSGAAGAKSD